MRCHPCPCPVLAVLKWYKNMVVEGPTMSLNWLVAELLKSTGRGEEMGPDRPPVPDTWYAEVFCRVMPAGYDPTWSPPAVKKSDSARKEETKKKSW